MLVAVGDAKAQFSELIRRVQAGEDITLTRHGKPVARLTAAAPGPRTPLVGAMAGQFEVPDGFDRMAEDDIRALFES